MKTIFWCRLTCVILLISCGNFAWSQSDTVVFQTDPYLKMNVWNIRLNGQPVRALSLVQGQSVSIDFNYQIFTYQVDGVQSFMNQYACLSAGYHDGYPDQGKDYTFWTDQYPTYGDGTVHVCEMHITFGPFNNPGTIYLNLSNHVSSSPCSWYQYGTDQLPWISSTYSPYYTLGTLTITPNSPVSSGASNSSCADCMWRTNGTNVFDTTGNVGIGTSSPLHELDVAGVIAINGSPVISSNGSWAGEPVPVNATGPLVGSGTPSNPITIGQVGATTGQTLKWNGVQWAAGDDLTYDESEADSPIWNANMIQSTRVASFLPDEGNVLTFRDNIWQPLPPGSDVYSAGDGIAIDSTNIISATNNSAMWNANRIRGSSISTQYPQNGQTLLYLNNAWTPSDLPSVSVPLSGWMEVAYQGGNINTVTTVSGNVGIGTENPVEKLDVHGAIAVNGKQVINSNGEWVGEMAVDSAQQAALDSIQIQMDTLSAQQDRMKGQMEQMKDLMKQMKGPMTDLQSSMQTVQEGMQTVQTGDSLLQVALANDGDTTDAMAMIRDGMDQVNNGRSSMESAQRDIQEIEDEMLLAANLLSTTASVTAAAISAASAAVSAIAAAEATVAASEATLAAAEATAAAAEGTIAAAEATLAAAEASVAALEASLSAIDASGDATAAASSALDADGFAQSASDFSDGASRSADRADDAADRAQQYAQDAENTLNSSLGGDLTGTLQQANVVALRGTSIATIQPNTNQILKYTGGAWTPSDESGTNYAPGRGILIRHDTIIADARQALWNASELQGMPVNGFPPDSGQVLQWNGSEWIAGTLPAGEVDTVTGWRVESLGNRQMLISTVDGPVGIGTENPDSAYKLSINGWVRAKKVVVESGWADHVFSEDYNLLPLESVAKFIHENGHLPGVTPAKEIQSNGLDVGKAQTEMMAKIEELTLYMLQMKAENEALRTELNELKSKLED